MNTTDDLMEDFERHYAGTHWPCPAGLLAGTLDLMTRWADALPDATSPHRRLLARRIASQLFFLREHPEVPGGLRFVATRLHARWTEIASAATRAAAHAASGGETAPRLARGLEH
jgi:hypothetical protein